MKWLNQISIKVKVMLPICILGIVILLASISSLVNSKRLLQAGVVISQDCSKSIELLMDMSSELESMGKNMYGHCDAENSISKESFATTIHEKLESMDSYFKQYKKQKKTAREKEYFGALQNRFKKYKEGTCSSVRITADSTRFSVSLRIPSSRRKNWNTFRI